MLDTLLLKQLYGETRHIFKIDLFIEPISFISLLFGDVLLMQEVVIINLVSHSKRVSQHTRTPMLLMSLFLGFKDHLVHES